MQIESSLPTSPRPIDPERIAALIDGRLSADERTALLADLEASPDAFEICSDAVAALRESDDESSARIGGGGSKSPRPPRPFRVYASIIAVAAVLMIAVALPLMRRGRAGELDGPRTIAASLQPTGD